MLVCAYHGGTPGANVVLLAGALGGAGGVLFVLEGEGEDAGAALTRALPHLAPPCTAAAATTATA